MATKREKSEVVMRAGGGMAGGARQCSAPRRKARGILPGAVLGAVLLAVSLALGACQDGPPELDTRTFKLDHLSSDRVHGLIEPYVWESRPGAPGDLSFTGSSVTVRETADNLQKIGQVLDEYDVPQPQLRLHFQLIEANGSRERDPAIADVEEQLQKLFRFDGYSLVGETMAHGIENGEVARTFIHRERAIRVHADIRELRSVEGGGGVVALDPIGMAVLGGPNVMESSVRMRTGQTVVIGSTPSDLAGSTLILTVRAELVEGSGG